MSARSGSTSWQDPTRLAFLERLYPCHVHDLPAGRLRYTLLLGEHGYVVDDGLICALGDGRLYLTFTSGGGDHAEATCATGPTRGVTTFTSST